MNEKKAVRAGVGQAIEELSPEQRIVLDAQIGTHITHLPFWEDAEVVVGYMALADEVDLQAVLRAALQDGKRIALPRIVSGGDTNGAPMTMHLAPDFPLGLERHRYGFLQPTADAEKLSRFDTALVLVPGRAFNRAGHRVGRGGGYYDRFLSSCGNVLATVGVAYAVQLRSSIPVTERDQAVQIVITDSETCFCSRPGHT